MRTGKMQRSEETKQNILRAAGELFAARGFDAVTMREIARAAGCSHTAIYIYFKDKEALLHELSMPPLAELKQQMEAALADSVLPPVERLKRISRDFIRFCLQRRNMYNVIFAVHSERVDAQEPKNELNRMRNSLFALLVRALKDCLVLEQDDPRLLAFSRIFFYTLHGIVGTYAYSEESADGLMARLQSTFDGAVEVLIAGFQQKLAEGG